MNDILLLIRIAVQFEYTDLFKTLLRSKFVMDDSISKDIMAWIKDFYDKEGQMPDSTYLEMKYEVFKGIGLSAEPKNEHFYVSVVHDINQRQDVNAIRIGLAQLSSMLDGDTALAYDKLKDLQNDLSKTLVKPKEEQVIITDEPILSFYARMSEIAGSMLGIRALDDHIRGCKKGTVITIFGFTASFKTTLAVSAAYYNCIVLKHNTAYITLEVPKYYLRYMLCSRHSLHPKFRGILDPIPYKDIFDSVLTDSQMEALTQVDNDLREGMESGDYGKFAVYDITDFSMGRIEELIENTPVIYDDLYFDYIQLAGYMPTDKRNFDKKGLVNVFINKLHDFSKTYRKGTGLVVYLLSQANRDGYVKARKKGGRYDLMALAEASELERASFIVLALYSDDKLIEKNVLSYQILKFRGGPTMLEPQLTYLDPKFAVTGDLIEIAYDDIVEALF